MKPFLNKRRMLCLDLRKKLAAQTTEINCSEEKNDYSEVSFGYAGLASEQSTLNARFYHLVLKDIEKIDLKDLTLFPQRVPRVGFFAEIKSLSNAKLSKKINEIQNSFRVFIEELLKCSNQEISDNEALEELAFIKMALRYGVELSCADSINIQSLNKRIQLPVIDIIINQAVSNDEKVPLKYLINALEVSDKELRPQLINRLIVAASRYDKDFFASNVNFIKELTNELQDSLDKHELLDNQARISIATMFRGIPMSPYFDKNKTLNSLLFAQNILDGFEPNSELEEIVKKENLHTLYLTISKFYLFQENNESMFVDYVNKMINLDPFDSTAYFELGLYYYKQKRFSLAQTFFEKCTILGPPSIAMSYYFLGESLENQGMSEEALRAYQKCSELDSLAISPLLKMYNYFKSTDLAQSEKIVNKLLTTSILREQLTEEEVCELQLFLK